MHTDPIAATSPLGLVFAVLALGYVVFMVRVMWWPTIRQALAERRAECRRCGCLDGPGHVCPLTAEAA